MKSINKYALLTLSVLALAQSAHSVSSEGNLVVSDLVSSVKAEDDILILEDIGPYANKQAGKDYYKNIDKLLVDDKEYKKDLDGPCTFDINYKGVKIKSKAIQDGEHKLTILNAKDGDILVTFKKEGKKVTFLNAQEVKSKVISSSQALKSYKAPQSSEKKQEAATESAEEGFSLTVTKLENEDGALLFPEFERYSSNKMLEKLVHDITTITVNDVSYEDKTSGSLKDKQGWVSDLKGLHIASKDLKEGKNTITISSKDFEAISIVIEKSGNQYSILSSKQAPSQVAKGSDKEALDFTSLEGLMAKAQALIDQTEKKEAVKGLAEKLQVIKDSYKDIDSLSLLKDTEALLKDLLASQQSEKVAISKLTEGTYTLSFTANKEHTEESSMLQGTFDKKAKLVVKKDGSKELTMLNTALGAFLIDFSVETDGKFPTAIRKQVGDRDINNAYVRSEFTLPIDHLETLHKGAVLVSAMGGQESDKHHYDKYTKLDMTFDQMATKGWTGYQAEIDDKEKGVGSERLEKALVSLGKDLNGDGKMSPEELAKITGELRLDHYDLTDISLLKDATNISELYLVGNQISQIPKDTFSQMKGLKVLELQSNLLTNLDRDLFAHNSQLTKLQLASNYLASIEPEAFSALNHLDELDLSKNRLSRLEASSFSGLSH